MGQNVPFNFKGKEYRCEAHVDTYIVPGFVFVILKDEELAEQFGDDITLLTDFRILLHITTDNKELTLLKDALFSAVTHLPDFINARERLNYHVQHV